MADVIGTRVRGAAGCDLQVARVGTVVRIDDSEPRAPVAVIEWDGGTTVGTCLVSRIHHIAKEES